MSNTDPKSAAALAENRSSDLMTRLGPRFQSSLTWVNRKATFWAVAAIGAWFPEAADAKSTDDLLMFYKDWARSMLPWI